MRKHLKTIGILSIVCTVLILSFICIRARSSSQASGYIHIIVSEWNDMGAGDVIDMGDLEAKRGQKIDLTHGYSLKIVKVSENSITIKTNEPMDQEEEGKRGIDLGSKQMKFTINKGETIILNTLMMDAGARCEISYH